MSPSTLHRWGGALALGLLASFSPMLSAETVVATTETAGTVSEFSPDALVIRTERDPAPVRYVVGRDVTYVDDTGAPVGVEVVRSGLPVTVHYVRDGERVIARRVVVHRTRAVTSAPVVEERRVVNPAPVIEERRVVAPVVEERRTVVTPPVVTVPPIVEERRTTTTTTTRER